MIKARTIRCSYWRYFIITWVPTHSTPCATYRRNCPSSVAGREFFSGTSCSASTNRNINGTAASHGYILTIKNLATAAAAATIIATTATTTGHEDVDFVDITWYCPGTSGRIGKYIGCGGMSLDCWGTGCRIPCFTDHDDARGTCASVPSGRCPWVRSETSATAASTKTHTIFPGGIIVTTTTITTA